MAPQTGADEHFKHDTEAVIFAILWQAASKGGACEATRLYLDGARRQRAQRLQRRGRKRRRTHQLTDVVPVEARNFAEVPKKARSPGTTGLQRKRATGRAI